MKDSFERFSLGMLNKETNETKVSVYLIVTANNSKLEVRLPVRYKFCEHVVLAA